ncbi:MAG: hypothetical protein JST54_10370 [Deltaproteobacteria bacterium]|nr:hypothetical protein [Deltaproteobacteria bacterium]
MRPFESWSARAKALARPLAENAYRLLELEPGAPQLNVARNVKELVQRLRAGRDVPRMLATGPAARTVEQVEAAAAELNDAARAARHALFVPWLKRLSVDGDALPAALDALSQLLREMADPVSLVTPLAVRVLPGADQLDDEPEGEGDEVHGGRLFAGDVDLREVLGPPPIPSDDENDDAKGFLSAVGKAPAKVADALLAATRLGKGRRLHASYLRSLLAQADGGAPSARRRLPGAKSLFDEVKDEPSGPLVLGWRDFVEGKLAAAKKKLVVAAKAQALLPAERARAQVLLARIALASGEDAAWLALLDAPEADAVRGAVALRDGNIELARKSLDSAWSLTESRPRVAPLLALALLAGDEVEAAARILGSTPVLDGATPRFARAWLLHAQGKLDAALDGYRSVLELAPKHQGAQWGLAVLSEEVDERTQARRALKSAAEHDTALSADLLELALQDGAQDELESGLEALDENDAASRELKVQVLDRLGRRAQAWKLRGEREEPIRDDARALLEAGDSLGALQHLAGLSLADPLRRRAARAAVLEALAVAPDAEPDAVVKRVLGVVTREEQALLDLPAHLYRAVRELQSGDVQATVASLRRHLDSGEDVLASRLFDVLHARAGEAWPALTRFLESILELDESTPESLIDAAAESDDEAWEAAVVAAAVQGAALEAGEFEGGSNALQLAAALGALRQGLLEGSWATCADALRAARAVLPKAVEAVDRAERAMVLARFPDAVLADPELALRALELANEEPAFRAHDVAVWRHFLAIGAEDALGSAQLVGLVQAWSAAKGARALVHPGNVVEAQTMEDEVLTALASLLGTIGPERAEDARAALEKLDDPLGNEAMARAGWHAKAARRQRG